jgi:hypothetical protein
MLSQSDGCTAGGVDNRDTVQQETRASAGHVWASSRMGSTLPRLLNGKRLIALSGVRDAAAATSVLCWQLDRPTPMKVTMDILAREGCYMEDGA